ncbi:MAG: LPS assembly lipoprotein LptE [Balneolales bacterium]
MNLNKQTIFSRIAGLLLLSFTMGGCLQYSFTGISIPSDVRTIYIPHFTDESGSGLGDLGNRLNDALVNRFVNQSRLQLTGDSEDADILLEGRIMGFSNSPYTIGGDNRAELNQVQISVSSSFSYSSEEEPVWDKSFSGSYEYDPNVDPIDGENAAAQEALNRIADNMFNDALGDW